MSGPHFKHSYRSVWSITKYTGLPLLDDPSEKMKSQTLFYILNAAVALLLSWNIVCAGCAIQRNSFEENIMLENVVILKGTAILLMAYYVLRGKRLNEIIKKTDDVGLMVMRNSTGYERQFEETFERNAERFSKYHKLLCLNTIICPFLFCASHPILAYMDGTYGQSLPISIYCDFEIGELGKNEIFTFFQFLGLAVPALQKIGNEFILFFLLKIVASFFTYISESMKEIEKDMEKPLTPHSKMKIVSLIILHQKAIKCTKEIVEIFSPVVIIYFLSMIGFTASGIFYFVYAQQTNFVQAQTLGMYLFTTTTIFYFLCHMAEEINAEAAKISVAAYSTPWYEADKEYRQIVQIMICLANKPLTFTAYLAPSFILNRESFLNFSFNVVSAFMGISKINAID
nr:olfactory receptor 60 [Tropidothorax elegans]QQP19785.1 olfactory receptor 90 [Tropidothorax elegans]